MKKEQWIGYILILVGIVDFVSEINFGNILQALALVISILLIVVGISMAKKIKLF